MPELPASVTIQGRPAKQFKIERIVDGKVSSYTVHGSGADCFVEELPTGGKRIFPFADGWKREDGLPPHADQICFQRSESLTDKEFCCKARPTGDPPQDCDFPLCGCSRVADEAVNTLIESGWLSASEAGERQSQLRSALAAKEQADAQAAAMRAASDRIRRWLTAVLNDQHNYQVFMADIKAWLTALAPDAGKALLERGNWQPIHTAPKSRQSVLVYCPGNQCSFVVSWMDWGKEQGWHYFGGTGGPLLQEPSHWMPLPAAPAAPAESEVNA